MFFSIPNLSARTTVEMPEPWAHTFTYPNDLDGKAELSRWRSMPSTQHAFLSLAEGLSPLVRASYEEGNPVHQLHGIIADYDTDISLEMIMDKCRQNPVCEFRPAYAHHTFSGGARLLFLFEDPMMIAGKAQGVQFITEVNHRLRLKDWLPGLDVDALGDLTKYYDIGRQWYPLAPEYRVPKVQTQFWMWESLRKHFKIEVPDALVPIEAVEEEVHKRYPGRWSGPFEPGRRGVRFWDPTASDPSGAVVLEQGMYAFSGEQAFLPWRKIFGAGFVDTFEGTRVSKVLDRLLWEETTQDYWVLWDDERGWQKVTQRHLNQWLRTLGYSTGKDKSSGCSAIERVELMAAQTRAITAALPFIFHPHGPLIFRGERILNTSTVKVMPPAEGVSFPTVHDAVKCFPWIWAFLRGFLSRVDDQPVQLEYLMSWMKHFYSSGYYMRPAPGHTVVLSGPTGQGKTFWANAILGRIMGGVLDGSDVLVKGSQWTDQMCKWPVVLVDDTEAASDYVKRNSYSAQIKKLVANQTMHYNGKYKSTGEVTWLGRTVICCNDDGLSSQLIPSMEASVADKISLLQVAQRTDGFTFPERHEVAQILNRELPFFCRWLLDMKYSEKLVNLKDTRYFLHPCRHPDLYRESMEHGLSTVVMEMITDMLGSYKLNHPEAEAWEGTATTLLKDLSLFHGSASRTLTVTGVSTALLQLRSRGYPVDLSRGETGARTWMLPFDFALKNIDKSASNLLTHTNVCGTILPSEEYK